MESNYETHIVGYEGTNFIGVPKPFFTNEIANSTQGFSQIATSEQMDRSAAYEDFVVARLWCEREFPNPDYPGVHVKLEAVCEQMEFDKLSQVPDDIVTQAVRRQKPIYIEDAFVSAWDVHLDGQFNSQLKQVLHNDGYIILDYLSSGKKIATTLTMHFLHPNDCESEYRRVVSVIKKVGGFSGNVYWEHPLAFVVYGDTIPRPIVCSFE